MCRLTILHKHGAILECLATSLWLSSHSTRLCVTVVTDSFCSASFPYWRLHVAHPGDSVLPTDSSLTGWKDVHCEDACT